MIRDLARLTATEHDLLVIGGGITGLIAAYDAAQRGLSVALIDRGDFGAATSFNHLKTVHGGLRYLQAGDLTRMRRSVLERRTFARIAPHLVSPLAFVTPTTSSLTRGRLAFATAFAIDRWVGRDRNEGLTAEVQVPAGRVLSLDECRRLAPGLELKGATGAAVWHDYQMPLADRLTFAFALAAHAHGAALANYVEALAPIRRKNRVIGVEARDVENDAGSFEIRARLTLNASGPWARSVMASCGIERELVSLKALNLVSTRPVTGAAWVRMNREGRALVLAPWRGRALIGTGESSTSCGPDNRGVSEQELEAFVGDVNATFPNLNLQREEVSLVHRGVVPAVRRNGRLRLRGQAEIVDHSRDGLEGFVTAIAVKYTTARLLAEQTVDLIVGKIGRIAAPCRTASVPLPGATAEPASLVTSLVRKYSGWMDEPVGRHLVASHGTGADAIARAANEQPALRERLSSDAAVVRAELVHAVKNEMARTLTDVVTRRTCLGTAGHPGSEVARACAEILRTELNWSAGRVSDEIEALSAFYDPVPTAR